MRKVFQWAKDKPWALRALAIVWLLSLPVYILYQAVLVVYTEVLRDVPGALVSLWQVLKSGKPL